jgi:XTP/dITP diphosphohydrolase
MTAGGRRLVVATRNAHKLEELTEILSGFELMPLPDEVELPPEDGETFSENALGKARAARDATGIDAIADDSGIAAVALGGRPGVRSARFAGEDATDEENLALLLASVGPDDDRRVAYVCAMAFAGTDGTDLVEEGRCEGTLAPEGRGSGGFGYDPAFQPVELPAGDGRTMAEITPDEKHRISHRGRAARALAAALEGRS